MRSTLFDGAAFTVIAAVSSPAHAYDTPYDPYPVRSWGHAHLRSALHNRTSGSASMTCLRPALNSS